MIDIIFHDVLDSTSLEGHRLVAAGKQGPFAVGARIQTAGRGRRGNHWSSLPGNLMLTLVLPPSIWCQTESLSDSSDQKVTRQVRAPIIAAILLARFVKQKFGFRPTLKWPNDLLFGGRKFAGILCEASSSSSGFGDLLIGIGLDISAAPHLSGADAAETTSLTEITGLTASDLPAVEIVARELCQYFVANWSALMAPESANALSTAFFEFGIEPGQTYLSSSVGSEPDGVARVFGISASGGLLLQVEKPSGQGTISDDAGGSGVIELTSVSHGWRWVYQRMAESSDGQAAGMTGEQFLPSVGKWPLIVADVGNTRTKVGVWVDRSAKTRILFTDKSHGNEGNFWREVRQAAGNPVRFVCHVSSVNEANLDSMARNAAFHGVEVVAVPKRPVYLRTEYDWSQIGADRIAAMEGFLGRHCYPWRGSKSGLAVIVCAGTATTIDLLDFSGKHFGGVILPGVTTGLAALHAAAPALPDFSVVPPAERPSEGWNEANVNTTSHAGGPRSGITPGMNTKEAIFSGGEAMVVGAIEVMVSAFHQRVRSTVTGTVAERLGDLDLKVVITGGCGEFVAAAMKRHAAVSDHLAGIDISHVPDLVLQGIGSMVAGGHQFANT